MNGDVPNRTPDTNANRLGREVAFPNEAEIGNYGHTFERPGLSKRELFAALVAQGLAPAYAQGGDFMEEHVAEGAVKVADALLRELSK